MPEPGLEALRLAGNQLVGSKTHWRADISASMPAGSPGWVSLGRPAAPVLSRLNRLSSERRAELPLLEEAVDLLERRVMALEMTVRAP